MVRTTLEKEIIRRGIRNELEREKSGKGNRGFSLLKRKETFP